MYKILVVDDEQVIREGLRHRIKALQLEHVGEILVGSNGLEALEIIRREQPHIVISDMMMPEMGGIELFRCMEEEHSDVKRIALSGFDDYSYVRNAFKHGAIDYLLKPVSMDELQTRLQSAIQKLMDDSAARQTLFSVKQDYDRLRFESSLQRLLSERGSELQEPDNEWSVYFPFSFCCVLLIEPASAKSFTDGWAKSIRERVSGALSRQVSEIVVRDARNIANRIVLVCNYAELQQWDEIHSALKQELKALAMTDEHAAGMTASQSDWFAQMGELPEKFRQAEHLLSYRLLSQIPLLSSRSLLLHAAPDQPAATKAELLELEQQLKSRSPQRIRAALDEWFSVSALKHRTIEHVRQRYAFATGIAASCLSDAERLALGGQPFRAFDSFASLSELKQYVGDLIVQSLPVNGGIERTIIDKALGYINARMREPITLADVSAHVCVNYSYLSKLFKEGTGMTFTAYITKLRMEEARKMLADPSVRIQEVSVSLCYDNIHNFSRAFKNYFGVSPSEYRKT